MLLKRRSSSEAPEATVPQDALRRLPDSYVFAPALATLAAPSPTSDVVHRIAAEVITRHLQLGRRGLAVCGAAAGAGATLAAANLAVALSQTGIPTVLIDANLREPGLDALISPPTAPAGLLQYMTSDVARSDVLQRDVLPKLDLMYAGGLVEDPGRVLAGGRFKKLVSSLMREYGCVIVDTPPANRCAETLAITAAVGYAIIVGRRNLSYIDDIRVLRGELIKDGVTVFGSIFNAG